MFRAADGKDGATVSEEREKSCLSVKGSAERRVFSITGVSTVINRKREGLFRSVAQNHPTSCNIRVFSCFAGVAL